MKKIAAYGANGTAIWVSRGDGSGTNTKEIALWKLTGLTLSQLKAQKAPNGSPWYLSAGAGMTATLQLANQKNGYTLSDIASFLTNTANNNIQLVQVVSPEKNLLNVYSVIVCNPSKNSRGNYNASMTLLRYMVSNEGQSLFANFGVNGQSVFKPWVTTLNTGSNTTIIQWVEAYAYIQGSECPPQYRLKAGDLYK